ncbi:MAG: polymerase sigma factor FliA [Clostridia bacterium]|nr:polymerase sigma factor FliA [Clostridia bacterium]
MEKYKSIDPQEYLPLVQKIAGRIDVKLPDHWDREDLIGYGVLGLMEAIKRYQPAKGVKFSTYASLRIRGAIMDALRKDAPVSRGRWELVRKITDAMDRLAQETAQEVPLNALASELGMDENTIEEALESFKFLSNVSLEQTLGFSEIAEIKVEDTISAPADESPEERIIRDEREKFLSEAISELNERQRLVLTLYYYEELTMKEIAEVLDVGVARVSQIKTSALASLRKKLERDG